MEEGWRGGGESYGCERLDEELGAALNEMMGALGHHKRHHKNNSWNEVRNGDKDDDEAQMVATTEEEAMTAQDLSMQIREQVLQNLQNMLIKRGGDAGGTKRVKIKISLEMEGVAMEETTAYEGPVRLFNSENATKETDSNSSFTYKCQSCHFSRQLTESNLTSIAEHIAVGYAPSISGLKRPPALFDKFLQRVKLSVNVADRTASASTVVVCKACGEEFGDPAHAQKHFHHNHNPNKAQLCLMCEKQVPDIEEHLIRHQSDHEQRFASILSCGCKSSVEKPDSVKCSSCREVFHLDPSLPKWMMRLNLCRGCLDDSPLTAVVCSCCRRGGNGRRPAAPAAAQSVSVCLECVDLLDSSEFLARRGRRDCRRYARGMLGQLVRKESELRNSFFYVVVFEMLAI